MWSQIFTPPIVSRTTPPYVIQLHVIDTCPVWKYGFTLSHAIRFNPTMTMSSDLNLVTQERCYLWFSHLPLFNGLIPVTHVSLDRHGHPPGFTQTRRNAAIWYLLLCYHILAPRTTLQGIVIDLISLCTDSTLVLTHAYSC